MNEGKTKGRGRALAVGAVLTISGLALGLLLSVVTVILLELASLGLESDPGILTLLVAGQLGFLFVAYLYLRRSVVSVNLSFDLDADDVKLALKGVVAALVIATVGMGTMALLGIMPESAIEDQAASLGFLVAFAVISTFLVAPIEEYLFRGAVQGRLRLSFGPWGAIIGSSAFFASVHVFNFVGPPITVIAGTLMIGLLGMVEGYLYERTGKLWVPIIAHAAYNLILIVVSIISIL